MPKLARKLSEDELCLGIILNDRYLFGLMYWGEELEEPLSPEQRMLMVDGSERQIWCLGRKIIKTLSIERDIFWFPIQHLKRDVATMWEALFFTPREKLLEPTRDRILLRARTNVLFSGIVTGINKSEGTMDFVGNWRWHFRIEGAGGSDKNMAGIRARVILGDEMAFGDWQNHQSRLMTAYPRAFWKYCGVPNGVRDTPFFKLDQDPDFRTAGASKWSHYNFPSFINPIYATAEAQAQLAKDYGGTNTQAYINNVLGLWGEAAYSSFPPGMIAVRELPVVTKDFTEKEIEDARGNFSGAIMIPFIQDAWYCVGLDFGHSPDPSVFCIAYTLDRKTWYELSRFRLFRTKLPRQVEVIHWLMTIGLHGRCLKLACDQLLVLQAVAELDRKIYHYDQLTEGPLLDASPGGSTVLVNAEGLPLLDKDGKEIKVRNKQHYTDQLKVTFQSTILGTAYPQKLWLGQSDSDLIEALAGMTEHATGSVMNYKVYECSRPDQEHDADALRYLQAAIMSAIAVEPKDTTMEDYEGVLGWAGEVSTWNAPWDGGN